MTQHAPPFRPALLAPQHWPAWVGLGLIWLVARLPYRVLLAIGRIMGWLAAREYAACFYDGQRHMMVHAGDPWRLHRILFAFPVGAHNLISQRLARRADAA